MSDAQSQVRNYVRDIKGADLKAREEAKVYIDDLVKPPGAWAGSSPSPPKSPG
jgi:hypothetical protein